MQTNISQEFIHTLQGQRAEKILRSCVHCGFCTATCPTYQLLGDELDSPRGRIYLIKQLLEGQDVTEKTLLHLDRCLTCRSCETTCPSGVQYGNLVEIGRELAEQKVSRSLLDKIKRRSLVKVLPYKKRFAFLLGISRFFRPALPATLKNKIPLITGDRNWSSEKHQRKMLILDGCVQPSLSPQINAASSRVLARLGIELVKSQATSCCGAVNQHLNDATTAKIFIKKNIDAWYPLIHSGDAEAIVITASGCSSMVKEYGYLMQDDPDYADKAQLISQACKDLSEIIIEEDLNRLYVKQAPDIAFHSPCTLQHSQKLSGVVESILQKTGFQLQPIEDSHLCCGSAGTYSLLQTNISEQLKTDKLNKLEKHQPDVIATANIGCLHHLASGTKTKVLHWIELLDRESS